MRDFHLDKMRTPRACFRLSTLPPFLPVLQSTKSTSIATMTLPQEHTQMFPDSHAKLSQPISPAVNHYFSPGPQNSGLGCISLFHFIAIFPQIAALEQCPGQRNPTDLAPARGDWYVSLWFCSYKYSISFPCQSSGPTTFPVSRPSLGKKDDFMLL